MEIGGFQKTTLIDYPGRVAAVVFLAGCTFRCPFCYSSEIVLPKKIAEQPRIKPEEIFDFLEKRKGLLEGVVLCGGEPTINPELPDFIKKIKDMDFAIKLDTNGTNPEMLSDLMDERLIDYVAMDIKGPKEKYLQACGVNFDMDKIQKSIDILKTGKVDYEFRSTIVPTLHTKEDIIEMANWIKGSPKYYLQGFRAEKTLEPAFEEIRPYPKEFLLQVQKEISPLFKTCEVRY